MDLKSLLNIKLERELIKDLNDHFKDELLSNMIESKVKDKIKNTIITIDNTKKIIVKDNQCCARSMGPNYSDIRCSFSTDGNIDYCKKHLKRIEEYGYLSFGRYDGKRPVINEKGTKIPWRDNTSMEDIDTIIQYQSMNLLKLIK
tara:strand:+ start:154 stop:588 length:435 start_codon:yes stop_codon:yes gene_type:complete